MATGSSPWEGKNGMQQQRGVQRVMDIKVAASDVMQQNRHPGFRFRGHDRAGHSSMLALCSDSSSIAGWWSWEWQRSRMFRRSSDPRSCRAASSRRYNSAERQGHQGLRDEAGTRSDWSGHSLTRADTWAFTVFPEVVRAIEIQLVPLW